MQSDRERALPGILLCDDNPRLLASLQVQIPWDEFECRLTGVAGSGPAALKEIRRDPPAILITDIRMPGMDGLQLIETLREEGFTPIEILITGFDEFEYAHRALRLKVFDFLLKPVDPEELLDTVSRAILTHRSRVDKIRDDTEDYNLAQNLERIRQSFFSGSLDDPETIKRALTDIKNQYPAGSEEYHQGLISLQQWIGEMAMSRRSRYRTALLRTPGEILRAAESLTDPEKAFSDLSSYIARLLPAGIHGGELSPLIANALRVIYRTDPRDLTLSTVADSIGISPAYLGDQLKKESGSSFSQTAREYRIGVAKTLLSTTNLNIVEISARIGYSGYKYFEKVFRQMTGMSPSSYRKYPGSD